MAQESFDILCLKAIGMGAEPDRVALYCASIIACAHAIARETPACDPEARRIVDLTRRLYALLPSKEVIGGLADHLVAEVAICAGNRRAIRSAREAFVIRMWRQFRHGSKTPAADIGRR